MHITEAADLCFMVCSSQIPFLCAQRFCWQEPCDINEHLPTLRSYASKCEVVAEMGVRNVVATYAFLKGLEENGAREKKLYCVNIEHVDFSPEKDMAAKFGDPCVCLCARACVRFRAYVSVRVRACLSCVLNLKFPT